MGEIEKFNVEDRIEPIHFIEDLVSLLDLHYNTYIDDIENKKELLTPEKWKDFSTYLDDLYFSYKDDLNSCFSKFKITSLNKENTESKKENYRLAFRKITYDTFDKYYPQPSSL